MVACYQIGIIVNDKGQHGAVPSSVDSKFGKAELPV